MKPETPVNVLEKPEMYATYQHYKGALYVPFTMCRIENGWVEAVAYYPEGDDKTYIVRPLTEWNDSITTAAGGKVRRFTKVEKAEEKVEEKRKNGVEHLGDGAFMLSGEDALDFLESLKKGDTGQTIREALARMAGGSYQGKRKGKKTEAETRQGELERNQTIRDALLTWAIMELLEKHNIKDSETVKILALLKLSGLIKED